jgi:hypothetical protein
MGQIPEDHWVYEEMKGLVYGSASSAPQLIGEIVSFFMSRGAMPAQGTGSAWHKDQVGLSCRQKFRRQGGPTHGDALLPRSVVTA